MKITITIFILLFYTASSQYVGLSDFYKAPAGYVKPENVLEKIEVGLF